MWCVCVPPPRMLVLLLRRDDDLGAEEDGGKGDSVGHVVPRGHAVPPQHEPHQDVQGLRGGWDRQGGVPRTGVVAHHAVAEVATLGKI